MVTKVFEKLVNNRLNDHLEKCGLYLISSMVSGLFDQLQILCKSSVVYDRIARVFNRSGATHSVALNISKAFGRVWHAGLLDKLKFYRISGQAFSLISFFLSKRWFRVILDGESSQTYPVDAGIPQGSVLGCE